MSDKKKVVIEEGVFMKREDFEELKEKLESALVLVDDVLATMRFNEIGAKKT